MWAKESVEAGLAGLSEREAARGALCIDFFQYMPSSNVKHLVVVSKFKFTLNVHVLNVKDIEDTYLLYCTSTVYLI